MTEKFQPNGELIPPSFRIVRQDPKWRAPTEEEIKKAQEDPDFVAKNAQETVKEVDFMLQVMHTGLEQRILDLGCGNGRHSNELAKRGYKKVAGIDIYKPASKLDPKVNFVYADWKKLPFRKGAFDLAFMLSSGLNYEDEPSVLKEVSETLKAGGYFLFDTPDTDGIVNGFYKEGMLNAAGLYKLKETETVDATVLTRTRYLDLKRQIIYNFIHVTAADMIETEEQDSHQFYTITQHSAMMSSADLGVENIFYEKNEGKPWYKNEPRAFILAHKR